MATENERVAEIVRQFHQIPIHFFPWHRELATTKTRYGRATTAILLAYLLRQFAFLQKSQVFYTDQQVSTETTLTPDELRTCKEDLKDLPFMTVFRGGAKGRTHYEIDWNLFAERAKEIAVSGFSRNRKTKPVSGNPCIGNNPKQNAPVSGKAPNSLRELPKRELPPRRFAAAGPGFFPNESGNGSNGSTQDTPTGETSVETSARFQKTFFRMWEHKYHTTYHPQKKDLAALKTLHRLFKGDRKEFKAAVSRFLETTENYFKGHPAAKLLSDVNRFTTPDNSDGPDGAEAEEPLIEYVGKTIHLKPGQFIDEDGSIGTRL